MGRSAYRLLRLHPIPPFPSCTGTCNEFAPRAGVACGSEWLASNLIANSSISHGVIHNVIVDRCTVRRKLLARVVDVSVLYLVIDKKQNLLR